MTGLRTSILSWKTNLNSDESSLCIETQNNDHQPNCEPYFATNPAVYNLRRVGVGFKLYLD